MDKKVAKDLLHPEKALGSFGSRADVAYSIGLVSAKCYKDLRLVAKIRNRFAHSRLAIGFSDPTIQNLCSNLNEWRVLLQGEPEETLESPTPEQAAALARNQFKTTAALLTNAILIAALSQNTGKNTGK